MFITFGQMSNETHYSQLCLTSVLLFSVRHVFASIKSPHLALIRVREETTLTCNTLILNQYRKKNSDNICHRSTTAAFLIYGKIPFFPTFNNPESNPAFV